MTQYYGDATPVEKNRAVMRKALDLIPNGNFISDGYEQCQNMSFFQIEGITSFWKSDRDVDPYGLTGDILASCVRYGIPFAYVLMGDKRGIRICIGTLEILCDSLISSYQAQWPGIRLRKLSENPLRTCAGNCGGLFTGIPTSKSEKKADTEKRSFQIENICRGMMGRRFTYVILASGLSVNAVSAGHEYLLEEMGNTYRMIHQSVSGGAQGNITAETQDYHSKNYLENLEVLEESIREGVSRGMWRVNGYYAADDPIDARKLGNIIKASYSGAESRPEPFRVIEYNRISEVLHNTYMMADQLPNKTVHPLGLLQSVPGGREIPLYVYKFQTLLSSDQLAVLCQLPTKEFPGYYIDEYVEFDVSDRQREELREPFVLGDICEGGGAKNEEVENLYRMEKGDFTRHALIIGSTGGGKTNTAKWMMKNFWTPTDGGKKIPFLVIESAKREYWELRNLEGFEELLVFTLGSETEKTSVRYRLNPFETVPGISLQTHIDYLLSAFQAAFELYAPMPYVLEQAVYEVYSDRGWDIVENTNRYGLTEYPTLSDLHDKISVVIKRLDYHEEVQSNVRAALEARINSLMIGGKGAMLNTPRSIPIGELLSRPVVLELEDLGDDETKSFVIGMLLVQLYEYRKAQMTGTSKSLEHILMVEEAHRLLKNVSAGGEGNQTKAKSVEFFCNMLAEIRTYGQGILIADQIPTRLAPDTMKNTNLKIVHRTVTREDREAIGRSMNMTEEQINYLSSLRRGYAAVYAEGDNRPKCVKLPLVTNTYHHGREEVIREGNRKVREIAGSYDKVCRNHAGCSYCEKRCAYYETVKELIDGRIAVERVLDKWRAADYRWEALRAFLRSSIVRTEYEKNKFEKLCILGYVLRNDASLSEGARKKILSEYIRHTLEEERDGTGIQYISG